MRLLIVEDDRELREALSALLRQAGYEIDAHADGREAFNSLIGSEYDLAIVDLMLPGMNGLALVRNLRRQLVGLPILIITARDALEDRVSGLDAGADDYLTRPFGERELVARLCSLLRRFRTPRLAPARQLTVGSVMLDWSRHRVEQAGREISLTPTEFLTLQILMQDAGVPVTNEVLLSAIWGENHARHQENLRMIDRKSVV